MNQGRQAAGSKQVCFAGIDFMEKETESVLG